MLWALMMFPHHLVGQDPNLVSLSEFHIASAAAAREWRRRDLGPGELRRAWLSARDSGKSTWWNLIMPLWAMAHHHREFVLVFGDTGTMAKRHLVSLRAELAKNELLRYDYPGLCEPAMFGRKSVMDTQTGYLSASGTAMMVAGLDQGVLGLKMENRRPDLILLDDAEETGSQYSDHDCEQRLRTLREAVLPMSIRAAVDWVGTTTRMGSLLDQVRKGADWAREENFVLHHFPALVTDPETGDERSAWPEKWPLEYLQSIRHTRSFALNFQCMPMSKDGTHWTQDDFVYDTKGRLARMLDAKVLAIDPAVTSGAQSDQTGLSVVGCSGSMRKCLIERARGVRMDPAALRELVHRTLRADPAIRTVVCEVIQGGEWIIQALQPLPGGVKLVKPKRTRQSKLSRITELYDHYQRGEVIHAKPLQALEAQMLAHPTDHDDIVDSVDIGVRWLLEQYAPQLVSA